MLFGAERVKEGFDLPKKMKRCLMRRHKKRRCLNSAVEGELRRVKVLGGGGEVGKDRGGAVQTTIR